MNTLKKWLQYGLLGAIACLTLVSISVFSQPVHSQETVTLRTSQAMLQEAETVLMAQGAESSPITRYVAVLTKDEVVPTATTSSAFGAAGAVLIGDRLVVRGDFSNLSSPLRDYTTDPASPPNPNITSGVHIHRGEPTANGPFQYALQVSPSENGLRGRLAGEYTLTSEQVAALTSGNLYVDIHTRQNRTGELRGIFKPF
ncbi:CHRD domain-containing protein [Leptolyngbya sp. NIES-2104]|uniref:CHRD domain-containing protein n=1 Tax=Leptolyngbya sp. NIES-2104 TaxID=1552121 RepID=UPI0006EC5939|nr:CHRD domain-containing protein [Leptolyngbya sp. NIES-2104]GAP97521.1 hypothetical protein NIES2104_40680 [Leptolyngbya sp. NIES-2104]